MYTSLPRGVARCQHIKVNGTRCDSPALKGKAYCYFHFRNRFSGESSTAPGLPKADGQQPTAGFPHGPQPRADGPRPLSPPPDLFLLEDANSIQCALQWVLRRILDASIDHRQASLLLYGLQIAAANIKLTRFQPLCDKIIRTLPADPPAEAALEKASTSSNCHPELGRDEPTPVRANGPASLPTQATPPAPGAAESVPSEVEGLGRPCDSRQDAGATGATLKEPASPETDEQSLPPLPPAASTTQEPSSSAQPLPAATQLATDNRQLATASTQLPPTQPRRPKRSSRRPPTKSLPADLRPLTTTRPALSLMFQREVRRHLARLNFPSSPEADLET